VCLGSKQSKDVELDGLMQTIIALLNYLSQKPSPAMTHWKKDVEAAHLVLGAVEGDGV